METLGCIKRLQMRNISRQTYKSQIGMIGKL